MDYTDKHISEIKTLIPNAQINLIEDKKDIVDKYLPETDILVYSSFDYPDLVDFKIAKKLKWVHVTSAGASDTASQLKSTTILLTNSSGVHPIPISEHVFTYLLMFTRQFHTSYRTQIEEKKWMQSYHFLQVSELYEKTIGIVGFGRIGKQIAKLAKGFGMTVVTLTHQESETKGQFEEMLNTSDFVINCLPLTDETYHLFTIDRFKQMKSSAYFINVGRGKTVVEDDLIHALKTRIITGAGLDVFEDEPLPKKSELWNLKNVIITPHDAGWTPCYADRVINIFCSNLRAYLKHKPMPNLVDKEKGY